MIASDMFPPRFTLCLPLLVPTPLFYRPFYPPNLPRPRRTHDWPHKNITPAPLPSSRFAKRKPPPRYAKKGDATRGLPRRSPILVLLSPKHAQLRSSDGIRCFSAGMIASDMFPPRFTLCLPLLVPTPLFYRPFYPPNLPRPRRTHDWPHKNNTPAPFYRPTPVVTFRKKKAPHFTA